MRILVIDDDRTFKREYFPGARYARNSSEAIHQLKMLSDGHPLDEIWFDHDLGGEDTSRRVALWLTERAFFGNPYRVTRIYVHTQNQYGADWLTDTLGRYYNTVRVDVPELELAS